jgi:MerR family transcriptional regulator, light-induced transcriptional regulator
MFNIKSVAKMLEMPAVTIRAWERRYNVVTPTRSESGHRLYSEQDIEDLRWLKVQTESKGVNISQAVRMLERLREQREASPRPVAAEGVPTFETMIFDLLDALREFDEEKARGILKLGFSMFHYEDIFHQVLGPMLHKIGEEWATGKWTVAQEHFASLFVHQALVPFLQAYSPNPALPKVVALCPEGELHEIGLLMFTHYLRRHGFNVVYLGANMPRNGLDLLIEQQRIRIVAISLTDEKKRAETLNLVNDLQDKCPSLRFALGGQAFATVDEEVARWRVGGDRLSWDTWRHQVEQE